MAKTNDYSDLALPLSSTENGYSDLSIPVKPSLSKKDQVQETLGLNNPSMGQNIVGGMLHGIQSLLGNAPDLSGSAPESTKNKLFPSITDAYKLMGTSDQPFYTPAGAEQLLGEMWMPGKAAKEGYSLVRSAINPLIEKFSPESHANMIAEKLSPGLPNVTKNATSLANDIRNAHDMRKSEAGTFLNHALGRAGKEEIYNTVNPLISTEMDKNKYILNKLDDLNIGDLYDSFKKKPNFQNAHNLQSELGVLIGDLEKNPALTIADKAEIGKIKSIRDTLKSDISSFLKNRDSNSNENLLPAYQKGIDLYRENVAPYLSSKKLRDLVRGGKSVVKNIHSIFDTPSNIIDRSTGETKIGPINKIMQDLPESAKNKIVYSAIGGKQKDANALLRRLTQAENKGFSNYFTPEIQEDINSLNKKVYNKEKLGRAGKIAGGALGIGAGYGLVNHLASLLGSSPH